MKRYTVRIQLDGTPSAAVYDRLHASMERLGGLRYIQADDGTWYWMPHSEYNLSAEDQAEVVRNQLASAVRLIWVNSKVFVTEAGDRAWSGLEPTSLAAIQLSLAAA